MNPAEYCARATLTGVENCWRNPLVERDDAASW
jgi:hypothetical protein